MSLSAIDSIRQGVTSNIGTFVRENPDQLLGFQGDQGLKGGVGDQGDTGPIGATGPQGSQGQRGAQGERGEKGKKGDDGKQGDLVFPNAMTYDGNVNIAKNLVVHNTAIFGPAAAQGFQGVDATGVQGLPSMQGPPSIEEFGTVNFSNFGTLYEVQINGTPVDGGFAAVGSYDGPDLLGRGNNDQVKSALLDHFKQFGEATDFGRSAAFQMDGFFSGVATSDGGHSDFNGRNIYIVAGDRESLSSSNWLLVIKTTATFQPDAPLFQESVHPTGRLILGIVGGAAILSGVVGAIQMARTDGSGSNNVGSGGSISDLNPNNPDPSPNPDPNPNPNQTPKSLSFIDQLTNFASKYPTITSSENYVDFQAQNQWAARLGEPDLMANDFYLGVYSRNTAYSMKAIGAKLTTMEQRITNLISLRQAQKEVEDIIQGYLNTPVPADDDGPVAPAATFVNTQGHFKALSGWWQPFTVTVTGTTMNRHNRLTFTDGTETKHFVWIGIHYQHSSGDYITVSENNYTYDLRFFENVQLKLAASLSRNDGPGQTLTFNGFSGMREDYRTPVEKLGWWYDWNVTVTGDDNNQLTFTKDGETARDYVWNGYVYERDNDYITIDENHDTHYHRLQYYTKRALDDIVTTASGDYTVQSLKDMRDATGFCIGDQIMATWPPNNKLYAATVFQVDVADQSLEIRWDDGSTGYRTHYFDGVREPSISPVNLLAPCPLTSVFNDIVAGRLLRTHGPLSGDHDWEFDNASCANQWWCSYTFSHRESAPGVKNVIRFKKSGGMTFDFTWNGLCYFHNATNTITIGDEYESGGFIRRPINYRSRNNMYISHWIQRTV